MECWAVQSVNVGTFSRRCLGKNPRKFWKVMNKFFREHYGKFIFETGQIMQEFVEVFKD